MADSDDEYDRKRRDKFRGERAEVSYRGAERVSRPRDDWSERDSWSRPRPRDYRGGGVRDRGYSPSMEPAPKRMRHDYYGESYYGHYGQYHQPSHRAANFFREPVSSQSEGSTPPMMSFKAFLATQDDNISESEAIEKYNDYKLEFQRQQLNEFFVAHKDDEWFRLKYHPEDSVKRKEEQMAALKKRVEVFLDLYNSGKLEGITVDCCKTNQLLQLMDTVVIKLEGGTDEDLATLEQEYIELEEKSKEQQKVRDEILDKKTEKPVEPKKDEPEDKTETEVNEVNQKTDEEENGEILEEKPLEELSENKKEDEKMETTVETNETMEVEKDDQETSENDKPNVDESNEVDKKEEKPDTKKEKKRKRSRSYSGSSSSSSSSSSESEDEKEKVEETTEKKEEKDNNEQVKEEEKVETIEEDKPEKPKALHKTTSIFLRNLAPTITKQEVEAICARYAGFLRVALAEPQPERRWLRRGWVTFKRDANIKEICWNLNNIRLRDCELGAIVNRDLSRRIRAVNGITAHKQVVRSDINIASRVILHMDTKAGLWLEGASKDGEKNELSFGLKSNNPVLHNITDYLIEEASAEEEELLGLEPCADNHESTIVDRDDTLLGVLDKIILYLRIVHSVDYYNHCEYPNEDEMPNRCGILHARGPAPTAKTDMTLFIGEPIENKMSNFLPEKKKEESKNEAKLIQLSLKDQDTEIDKFIQANTRELAKDKWLCPLSGKKFKGPDFVRKHIFNKHGEKIEEVKKEVDFFNNYLRDPKRPMLTDAPQSKREEIQAPYSHPNGPGYGGGYGRPQPYNNYYAPRARGYAPRTRGAPSDFRPVIHYRDLDAPREPEEFI
ncbi:serrate RNA effector molecule homolog isoform X2 [Harmonia axyridis]|uniref:serrate RNA effector molecule homolog isoform X2 n=1 Tax=Harmonia axyridis TaxID=115357 RepID=UPI001E279685|nr:serrate RNA effector molecule homolog isoform X2 [Harmonia axyridis]